ncbi:MAG: tyrosine--tRNA ligase, partial [bacterium]
SKYTVARILERDDFTNRMKEQKPISLHELLYPLIQGYDSVMLESDVEMCGTDQKFNCLVGRALQQEVGQKPEVILSMPILEGLDGVKKMSKSLNNYVGVTDPPNEMFSKLMSISDKLMWKYYEYLLEKVLLIIPEEVQENVSSNNFSIKAGNSYSITSTHLRVDGYFENNPIDFSKPIAWKRVKDLVDSAGLLHPKISKLNLARGITENFHSFNESIDAWNYFENRHQLSETVDYPKASVGSGAYKAADFMLTVGISKTKSDAKRLIEQGAVEWVDGRGQKRKIASFAETIELAGGETGLIRAGKIFLKITAS